MPSKYQKIGGQFKPIKRVSHQKDNTKIPIKKEYVKTNGSWELVFEDASAFLAVYNYGYICSGIDDSTSFIQTIDRFEFPLDAAQSMVDVGNILTNRGWASGCNSSVNGFIFGGFNSVDSEGLSSIERFKFTTEMSDVNDGAFLSAKKYRTSSNNSSLYGYICGGSGPSTSRYDDIEEIMFPFDSGNVGTVAATLPMVRNVTTAVNNTLYGYICAGTGSSDSITSFIERFEFSMVASGTTQVGDIGTGVKRASSANSSTHGYVFGGEDNNNAEVSDIRRFAFPVNNASSTIYTNLGQNLKETTTNNSTTYAYVCGGRNSSPTDNVERLLFDMNTATSEQIATLSSMRFAATAIDPTDFTTQFV